MTLPATVEKLSADDRCRLERIAAVRDEPPAVALGKLRELGVSALPRSLSKHIRRVRRAEFAEAGVRDGLPFVRLANGRVFYGHLPTAHHLRGYACVRDILPAVLTEQTFLIAIDVAQRYLNMFHPPHLLPGRGGRIVEVGAYLGHKTLRLADEVVGPSGRILAIEMMPENVEILRRNVRENGLEGTIEVLHCGAWSGPGAVQVQGKGRQRNSLVALDKLDAGDVTVTVPADSLDNILDRWGEAVVDFLPITANGAEVEILRGLDRRRDSVKVLWVVACYTRDDGQTTWGPCRDLLTGGGCVILPQTTETALYAAPARWAGQFAGPP